MSYLGVDVWESKYRSVAQEFKRQNLHQLPIDKSAVAHLNNCFKETGSVADSLQSGRLKRATNLTSTAVI